jgi:hypothetical protein
VFYLAVLADNPGCKAFILEIHMSNQDTKPANDQAGIDVSKVDFDANGEVAGLDDAVLAAISSGTKGADDQPLDTTVNVYKCGKNAEM